MKKSILITGCSSGIGYETAHYLHRHGYDVYATARNLDDVEKLREEGLNALRLDVTDTDSIDTALESVLTQTGGTLYALFNNAGYGQPGALEDLPSEALREQFETNVIGLHEMTKRIIPVMRAQGYGRIIQHSSILGLISLRFRGAYNASKYAIEGLCDTLRLELQGSNIRVVTMNTGPIHSRFRENATKKFLQYIDIEKSVFIKEYQEEVLARKEKKSPILSSKIFLTSVPANSSSTAFKKTIMRKMPPCGAGPKN
jgi:NAD(P)-dependent dehydrogenase (short-subunit alcohol dehydrogenase family)